MNVGVKSASNWEVWEKASFWVKSDKRTLEAKKINTKNAQ